MDIVIPLTNILITSHTSISDTIGSSRNTIWDQMLLHEKAVDAYMLLKCAINHLELKFCPSVLFLEFVTLDFPF